MIGNIILAIGLTSVVVTLISNLIHKKHLAKVKDQHDDYILSLNRHFQAQQLLLKKAAREYASLQGKKVGVKERMDKHQALMDLLDD